jgi:hypothetical protein
MVLDEDGAWSDEVKRNIQVNGYPSASIESISPDDALIGELIFFTGSGTDDGSITAYNWESDIDGFLSSKETFSSSSLSSGVHSISLTVRDNKGAWSEPVYRTISVREIPENIIPRAFIDSVEPATIEEGEEITFVGHGEDEDGDIEEYFWQSDIDGLLSDERTFSTKSLSAGTHVITFRVRDNSDEWSETAEVVVIVEEKKDEGPSLFGFDLDQVTGEGEFNSFCIILGLLILIIIIALIGAIWSRTKRRVY